MDTMQDRELAHHSGIWGVEVMRITLRPLMNVKLFVLIPVLHNLTLGSHKRHMLTKLEQVEGQILMERGTSKSAVRGMFSHLTVYLTYIVN